MTEETFMDVITCTPEDLLGHLNEVERKHAPNELYLAGDKTLLTEGARVAVVGSRNATPDGLKRAAGIAKALADRRIVVVSGLAEGVDTAAHRTAIAHGGRTIAVLGTPLDKAFPPANSALQQQIIAEHLAISQFPLGTRTYPNSFPMRNRTMALITDATVIVEAGEQSGTRHQGWEALRLGRMLFLMESFVESGQAAWTDEMLRYGARILSRSNLEDFLSLIPERTGGEPLAF